MCVPTVIPVSMTCLEWGEAAGGAAMNVDRMRRLGLNKLSALEPAEPIRRYEREHAGDLIHLVSKSSAASAPSGTASPDDIPAPSTVTTASGGSSFMFALTMPRGSRSCRCWPISAKRVLSPSCRLPLLTWRPPPLAPNKPEQRHRLRRAFEFMAAALLGDE
jgi:hypothetical protein